LGSPLGGAADHRHHHGFIPIELYEISRRTSFSRLAVLVINVGIVVYLVRRQRKRAER